MEGGCGGNRRLALLDHMSSSAVVGAEKRSAAATATHANKTLLDIIRQEEHSGGSFFGHKDKKNWKAFRDRIRLKRAGSAWTSSVHIPTSDVPTENHSFNNNRFATGNTRSFMSRRNSVRFTTVSSARPTECEGGNDGAGASGNRPQITRRMSTRFGASDSSSPDIDAVEDGPPAQSFKPQMSRYGSARFSSDPGEEGISPGAAVSEDRSMSAREAVAAQEAAEAARDAAEEEDDEDGEEEEEEEKEEEGSRDGEEEGEGEGEGEAAAPAMTMSLMDLLEETDRQMGVVGSSYKVEEYGDEEEEDDDGDGEGSGDGGGVERTCCVCMVRHKGAAFIPCGHTFCRLCSRELLVQRGNCPLCNGYILEILDIF